jgi:hypothetical protein
VVNRTKSLHNENHQTETLTFRIDRKITKDLRTESKQKGESLNVLINQILKDYVDYYKPAKKAGSIHFSKRLITRLFDSLSDEDIDRIAREHVNHDPMEDLHLFRQSYTLLGFMIMLSVWLRVSEFSFSKGPGVGGNDETTSIMLGMGRKYSNFFGKCIQLVCEHFKVNPNVEVTDNTVMFTTAFQSENS